MSLYRQDIDFQGIFRKLGHSIEEIRLRALENIISKLEHHLICEQDIIHERHLMIRLLEWFNFTPCTKQEQVLRLLCQLSQHWAAAEHIQNIGGIEFLTQLRDDIETNLKPVVDQILENVMRLPELKSQDHAPECIYHKTAENALWGTTLTSVDDASRFRVSMATATYHPSSLPSVTAEKLNRYDNPPQGYFDSDVDGSRVQGSKQDFRLDEALEGFKMTAFPWLPLTMTDQHVITSTNKSLQSKDMAMLISACEFLSDVVFQDFPAEIFIQRPQIVKSLLSLVGLAQHGGDPRLVVCAAHTLSDLCCCLQQRIRFYQDPTLYTPKQEFGSSSPSTFSLTSISSSQSVLSTDTRPSLVGWSQDRRHRGDGRDGDSTDSASGDSGMAGNAAAGGLAQELGLEDGVEEPDSLQHQQLSLPEFAASILQHALQALRGTHRSVTTECLRLGFEAWKILAVVVAKGVWSSRSASTRELVCNLMSSMETCSSLLDLHHHNHCSGKGTAAGGDRAAPSVTLDRGDLAQHRLLYLGVASLLSHLLHLIPTEHVSDSVPEELHGNIGALLFDESFALSYPQCHAVLTLFAQLLDLEAYRHFTQTVLMRQSLMDTCRFVLQVKSKALTSDQAVTLAESAITSLPYHLHLNLLTEFVSFFSHLSSKKTADKAVLSRCTGVLLKLLSHPLVVVRQHTYHNLLSTIQSCLDPEKAASSSSYGGHLEAKFILGSDILYEIVCFGLADCDAKVCSTAADLLFHLLQSQLLLGELLWQELVSALLKAMPILQSYTDLRTRFGRRLWSLLDPAVASDNLCLIDKLRGNLRLMFSADASLREEAVKRLCWFLANEVEASQRLPNMSGFDLRQLSALFIVETPHYLDEENTRSVFQADGLKQVYDIFTANPVDGGVKRSAAEQLAIMLQDPHLHAVFRENGGLEVILSILHQSLTVPSSQQQNLNIPLAPACVTMLRHLLHHDYTLRHNLSHDPAIYYDLIRVSVLMVRDENISYQVSHILVLLLFDEVAKVDVSCKAAKGQKAEKNFSLPAVVAKRYRLPFRPTVHHSVSPNSVLRPSENDILKTQLPQEMLRVAWNVAWCGGLDSLLQLLKTGGSQLDELRDFSRAMVLTPVDRMVLQSSGLRWGMQEGLYTVANATSHADVIGGLTRVLSILATIPSAECAELLNRLNWSAVLERFLQVMPSSPQDESLLLELLLFMNCVLKMSPCLPQELSQWLCQQLYDSRGPLCGLVSSSPRGGAETEDMSDATATVRRSVEKVLLQFIAVFISRLPYKLHISLSLKQARGDLAQRLMKGLSISAAPHFYNLAALEGVLACLMHLTARPGWSSENCEMEPFALCSHILGCLLEVVSAFHVGRGGTAMSYMGRGVTKAATLCLRQLACEIVSCAEAKQDWTKLWLYSRPGADVEAEPGLNWMLTLWAYRDAEVRAAGLGIAVVLASTEAGRVLLTASCRHIPGSLWGAAFSMLLDPAECSMVRQQAALLLVNLTSETIPNVGVENSTTPVWQGPIVLDVESNVSVAGLSALLVLLHHSHFYPQLAGMLSSFFPAPVLQPILVTTEVSLHSLDSSTTSSVSSTPQSREHLSFQATDQLSGSTAVKMGGHSTHSSLSQRESQAAPSDSSSQTPRPGLYLETSSSFSHDSRGDGEAAMSSIVTPCLVAAICQLLDNLVVMAPQDALTSLVGHNILSTLVGMINTSQLQELCQQLSSGPHRCCSLLTLRDLLRMYRAIISLLQSAVRINTPTRVALLGNTIALKTITSLLLLQCDSAGDLVLECRQLWRSVLLLLSALLQTQSATALQCLTAVLSPFWPDFSDALVHLLQVWCEETQEPVCATTLFLSLLLMEESRQLAKDQRRWQDGASLTWLLDQSRSKKRVPPEDDADRGSFTTGASLSKVLVSTYELTSTSGSKGRGKVRVSGDRMLIICALKSLLAVSQSAKRTALNMGLVETLIESMKQMHAELSLEFLQLGKNIKRKEESGLLQELVCVINILRNMMCGSEDVKLACIHSGLASTVHQLWAWCLQEQALMAAVLSLLVSFTAHCPAAAASLASTTSGPVSSAATRQQLVSSCLVLAITKAAQREVEREVSPLAASGSGSQAKLFFNLLTSLSLLSECRSLIWKSNLLQEFSKLSPGRSRKSRSCQLLDAMWLQLAVALSFSTDGQQILLRIDDCLTVLLDFLENGCSVAQCQEFALLILRNMCCHAANKPKILANEQVIPCLVGLVESATSSQLRTLAASALWALAYNNHKAKVAMKNINVIPRMQVCLKQIQLSGISVDDVKCSENIQAIVTTVGS